MQLPVSCSTVKPSCAVIFRLGIVTLYWVRVGEVVCGLRDVHVRKIYPVRDVITVFHCSRTHTVLPLHITVIVHVFKYLVCNYSVRPIVQMQK